MIEPIKMVGISNRYFLLGEWTSALNPTHPFFILDTLVQLIIKIIAQGVGSRPIFDLSRNDIRNRRNSVIILIVHCPNAAWFCSSIVTVNDIAYPHSSIGSNTCFFTDFVETRWLVGYEINCPIPPFFTCSTGIGWQCSCNVRLLQACPAIFWIWCCITGSISILMDISSKAPTHWWCSS